MSIIGIGNDIGRTFAKKSNNYAYCNELEQNQKQTNNSAVMSISSNIRSLFGAKNKEDNTIPNVNGLDDLHEICSSMSITKFIN